MAKLMIQYQQPADKKGFEEYYFHTHAPLAQKVPNVKGSSINRVVKAQNISLDLYMIIELEFENLQILQQTMATPEWNDVMQDAQNLDKFLNEPPIIVITELPERESPLL
ncbi:EthD family reductase [Robertmurraya andreesenii]|uniref:Uncharacterized protein (TIGR02118 family) n=1 Tax=Anoxybacillus andreesenii TaxID=1325932 RepID=A0ABT9V9W3_9BACL|nr:EthD family reductase [Robertmurraya andreesenii]MDQ0157741.1 uncharacterized protein (TIGR02118 family) [Robertmurraya andreesenii]